MSDTPQARQGSYRPNLHSPLAALVRKKFDGRIAKADGGVVRGPRPLALKRDHGAGDGRGVLRAVVHVEAHDAGPAGACSGAGREGPCGGRRLVAQLAAMSPIPTPTPGGRVGLRSPLIRAASR